MDQPKEPLADQVIRLKNYRSEILHVLSKPVIGCTDMYFANVLSLVFVNKTLRELTAIIHQREQRRGFR